jgi:hypothetical protein
MPRTTPYRGPQQQRRSRRDPVLSTMAGPDYVDFFTVTTSGAADRSPEQWARAAVEEAAGVAGAIVWRMLCGLVSSRDRRGTTWADGRSPSAATAGSGSRLRHGS